MDDVEEIKRRIDIVDLISSYLTLKKAGANYRAVCPFHQEKTPSFMVSPEKQIYKCFGCGSGGDVFTFVEKMENLEFREALEMLAQRAGVTLKRGPLDAARGKPDQKSRLYKLNLLATRAFHKILLSHPSGKIALDYLLKRGLTRETLKEFQVGYAPSSRAMEGFLKKHDFTSDEMRRAGSPERFYKRIIFPIRDVMQNTIAFTGRVIDPKQEPKYLNTPETVIFHKSRILYNLDQAKGAIKTEKSVVVVEGQMDVIASWQAGVKNVVATSGTALTTDHLLTLWRYTPNVVFSFDSDTAGLATAKKAYEMAIIQGMNVKMVNLGDFKDPGEMIAKDSSLWQKAVQNAGPVIDWYFALAFSKLLTADSLPKELTSQEKKEIAKEILPIIQKIPDSIEQAHYIGLLAKKLNVSETVVFDALSKVNKPQSVTVKPAVTPKNITSSELLLGILLMRPDLITKVKDKISEDDFGVPALDLIYKNLIKVYNLNRYDLKSLKGQKEFLGDLKKNLTRPLELKMDDLLMIATNEARRGELEDDLEETVNNIKGHRRENLKSYYAQEIQKAESAKDTEKLKKLIKEFQDAIS